MTAYPHRASIRRRRTSPLERRILAQAMEVGDASLEVAGRRLATVPHAPRLWLNTYCNCTSNEGHELGETRDSTALGLPSHSKDGLRPDRNAGAAAILRVLQDIAALTLACDLRDLRLAQRSGAHSPRLHGVATSARPPSGSWPTRSGAARLGADLGPRRLRRQSEPALVAAQSGSASSAALISEALRARMALWLILNMCA
jgi:hypothetical protein